MLKAVLTFVCCLRNIIRMVPFIIGSIAPVARTVSMGVHFAATILIMYESIDGRIRLASTSPRKSIRLFLRSKVGFVLFVGLILQIVLASWMLTTIIRRVEFADCFVSSVIQLLGGSRSICLLVNYDNIWMVTSKVEKVCKSLWHKQLTC